MGSYLSTSKGAAAEAGAPNKCDSPVYATAEVQKVTFADPPASEAKAAPSGTPSGPPEPVLKRKGHTPRAAAATPLSERPKRSAARTPRAAAPSPAPAAAAPAASPAPAAAAATPRAARRAAAGKKKASGKAAAAAAAPAPARAAVPDLVVVGKAMRQKGAVPARKVGMKRMAKRALYPVNAAGGRPARSKK